jgi:heterodisulfide reductase subunit C
MEDILLTENKSRQLIEKLEKQSGVKVSDCYQCGKCSAGCPMAHAMDLMPRQVIRYMQLGRVDEALKSRSIWICASCHTCAVRCPQKINLSGLMESLRQEAKSRGLVAAGEVDKFSRIFLNNIKLFGKSHEMLLQGLYNFTTGHFMQDMKSAPHMLKHKLVGIKPHVVKDRAAVRKLMKKSMTYSAGGDEE